ncbi:MAG TPA: DinB family protein [Saprospiraceae bacterium]|nr:DinB family protein [Saprospiraceae bacterium]HPG05514.1 DinB family protein [Saprospiraceae bacterium]HPQ98230.1 DinB family protein [Saprospiraceae bacterium]HRV85022.1 DinB family protein [Saprospiraceae bacterium]
MELKSYLIHRYLDTYEGSPWYGTAIRTILLQLTATDLTAVIPGTDKQLGQIILHMLAWRHFALAHLNGQDDYRLEVNSPQDWPPKQEWTNDQVRALVEQMDQNQKDLIQAIHEFPLNQLGERVPGKNYSYAELMEGVYTHDIYHAGQLQLGWRILHQKTSS